MMATRIFFNGAELIDFELEIVAGIVLLIGLFAGPLLVFSPMLARVKREGLREYGALGQTYVKEFRDKWLRGTRPADEALVGTGDIQSLADLGNSFATAEQMRFAPIRPAAFAMFVSSFLAPMLPLIFTVLSPQEVIDRLAGLVL
jgi:hypothetical protein